MWVVYLKRLRCSSSTSGSALSRVRFCASWYVPHALQKNFSSPFSVSTSLNSNIHEESCHHVSQVTGCTMVLRLVKAARAAENTSVF